ncbi:serine hydrolase domain-containing protein [Streptomyces sp. NPDC051109]|uniref:serine hydrolase domain-containing protein n=1 Tax=Streptomyces sp. NPDC051109 TaxID=3365642 RepID=UPI00378E4E31
MGLLFTALCAGTGPAAVRADFDPATVHRLDAAITKIMEQTGMPGLDIGLWIPGRGVYEESFGVADKQTGTPMKSDLYSRIGSVTKTFTVTSVLQLVDQGKAGLDGPISRYVSCVPGADSVTLRQLAEMRSGLFDYTTDKTWLAGVRAGPQRTYTPRRLVDVAFRHPPNFPPGAKWQYSNTNTILLGMVVEKASGQSLADYLREHVFAPLKLDDTSLPGDGAVPDPHAHGYTDFTPKGTVADATNWNPSWARAAGAIVSDLDDLHTWAPALADGRLGHNGELPGYETITAQLPAEKATPVALVNSDIDYRGKNLSSMIGHAVTSIVTPGHLWPAPVGTEAKQPPP